MAELPKTLQRSDKHAQDIWMETLKSAIETYGGDNGRSRRVAFASLKHEYEKRGDRWVRKAHKGPSDPQAARGPSTKIKSTDEPRAPTAGAARRRAIAEPTNPAPPVTSTEAPFSCGRIARLEDITRGARSGTGGR